MARGICDHPEAEQLMLELAVQLETVRGKKKFGYLPKKVKAKVDEIVDQMERITIVDDCYQVWWEFQCQVNNFYSEKERRRPSLSEQKEFRAIKNAVIQEAESIRQSTVTFEDEDAEKVDELETADLSNFHWEMWMVTQDDTASVEERDGAAAQLLDSFVTRQK